MQRGGSCRFPATPPNWRWRQRGWFPGWLCGGAGALGAATRGWRRLGPQLCQRHPPSRIAAGRHRAAGVAGAGLLLRRGDAALLRGPGPGLAGDADRCAGSQCQGSGGRGALGSSQGQSHTGGGRRPRRHRRGTGRRCRRGHVSPGGRGCRRRRSHGGRQDLAPRCRSLLLARAGRPLRGGTLDARAEGAATPGWRRALPVLAAARHGGATFGGLRTSGGPAAAIRRPGRWRLGNLGCRGGHGRAEPAQRSAPRHPAHAAAALRLARGRRGARLCDRRPADDHPWQRVGSRTACVCRGELEAGEPHCTLRRCTVCRLSGLCGRAAAHGRQFRRDPACACAHGAAG
mmetsp:Transcript_9681/g.30240  ORF Transcript_9681/g.30240 Transcript_9681/m.30240 type:complete len:345 (-) Transcript_9681:1272-2306(-)